MALGLGILGDGMLDHDARLVEDGVARAMPSTSLSPAMRIAAVDCGRREAARRGVGQVRRWRSARLSTIATVCSASISTSS